MLRYVSGLSLNCCVIFTVWVDQLDHGWWMMDDGQKWWGKASLSSSWSKSGNVQSFTICNSVSIPRSLFSVSVFVQHVCRCSFECGWSWKSEADAACLSQSFCTFLFETDWLNLEFTHSLRLGGILLPLFARVQDHTGVCHIAWLFTWVLRIWTQVV